VLVDKKTDIRAQVAEQSYAAGALVRPSRTQVGVRSKYIQGSKHVFVRAQFREQRNMLSCASFVALTEKSFKEGKHGI
jgi:hypothetical protein